MNQDRLMKVLVAPIVSEKSTLIAEKRDQVAFRVLQDATKPEIKAAVAMCARPTSASRPVRKSTSRRLSNGGH